MSVSRASIDRPLFTWLIMLACIFGGIWGFLTLGRLEDPAFTIKQAVVITQYPGASAEQVAIEVSEPLESAIQNLAEVDIISSINQPGRSIIDVQVRDTTRSAAMKGDLFVPVDLAVRGEGLTSSDINKSARLRLSKTLGGLFGFGQENGQ